MSGAHIYRKTEKGRTEIATRANKLGLRERSMLIMVDDKSTRRELVQKNPHPTSEGILNDLLANGYIETVLVGAETGEPAVAADGGAVTAASPTSGVTPVPAPAAAADPGVEVSVVSATRYATRALITYLGPSADELAAMVEKAKDAGELAKALAKSREVIHAMAGRRKADEFWAGVSARLPQP